MNALPDDVRQTLERLPNAGVATGFLWSWLIIQPTGPTFSARLPQAMGSLFDSPADLTRMERALFALHIADEVNLLLGQNDQISLSVDYIPTISPILVEAATQANISDLRINWPAKTSTVSSRRSVELCWGDGCQLFKGQAWSLIDAVKSHEDDQKRPPE